MMAINAEKEDHLGTRDVGRQGLPTDPKYPLQSEDLHLTISEVH
jgi:hypothetical protein